MLKKSRWRPVFPKKLQLADHKSSNFFENYNGELERFFNL